HHGDHQVLSPHERRRVLLHRRPATVYEVDLGLHHAPITADLPSRDPSGSFHAELSVSWRVLDPSAVVRHQLTDVQETLAPDLLHRARKIAGDFGVDQRAAAEDEINTRLGARPVDVTSPDSIRQALADALAGDRLGADYGLWTRVVAQLTLDDAAREHNAKMTQITWAIAEENAQHKLRVLQEENQRQIMADRIAVYRQIVAAGDTEAFAMQLALHPADITAIAKILKDEELSKRRETVDFVAHMVDSGVVERWEVSDQAREALQWLKDATARVIHERNQRGDPQVRQGRAGPAGGDLELPELPAAASPAETVAAEPPPAPGADPGGS
ncbi:MAG: hypothetical protein ACHP9Z_28785, partial [Streptosporangiales bacterium]